MRIVHICRTNTGGGLIAIHRLHRGLLQEGHESMLFVAESEERDGDSTIRVFNPPCDLAARIRRRIRRLGIARDRERYLTRRPVGSDFFTDDRCVHGRDVLEQLPPCDIVNIHTMYGFMDYRAVLGALAERVPIVETLHDMVFFTGGCHVTKGCDKFVAHCGACPQLGSANPKDLSHQIWMRKHSVLSTIPANRLWLVSPSRWMGEEVKRSSLAGRFPLAVIPNGADTEVFKPRDRTVARDILGIPSDARVVLFIAEPMHRPVKGFAVLCEALAGLTDDRRLMLLSVGGGRPAIEVAIPHMKLSSIHNDGILSLVYSAADLLVVPSLQENLPLVPLEAMACGIPVVGSDISGIREVVRPGVTGRLVPSKDPAALRGVIAQLLDDPAARADMSTQGRRLVVEEFSLALQVRRHVELYTAILSGGPTEPGSSEEDAPQGRPMPLATSTPAEVLRC